MATAEKDQAGENDDDIGLAIVQGRADGPSETTALENLDVFGRLLYQCRNCLNIDEVYKLARNRLRNEMKYVD